MTIFKILASYMALLQTCTYARITYTLRLAYAAHQVRRLMTGVRTSPSGLLDDWRATHTYVLALF